MAHHRYTTGLLGPVTQTMAPARVRGVRQYGGEVMPSACPHCHTESAAWTFTETEGRCWVCGATFFRTCYEVGPPVSHRGGNPHPVPMGGGA